VTASTPAATTPGAATPTTAPDTAAPVEDATASVEVAGAYLTSCGPAGTAPAGVKDDDAVFGCGVFDAQKVLVKGATVTGVTAHIDGAAVPMVLAKADIPLWSETFVLSAAQFAKLEGFDLAYKVGDKTYPSAPAASVGVISRSPDAALFHQFVHFESGSPVSVYYAEANRGSDRDDGVSFAALRSSGCNFGVCVGLGAASNIDADGNVPIFEVTHPNGAVVYAPTVEANDLIRPDRGAWTVGPQAFRVLSDPRSGTARSRRLCRLERKSPPTIYQMWPEPVFAGIVRDQGADFFSDESILKGICPAIGFTAD
jgi:hypothetical protein